MKRYKLTMTPENFCYWLKGYIELTDSRGGLTQRQLDIIADHLGLVMNKVTPERKLSDDTDNVPTGQKIDVPINPGIDQKCDFDLMPTTTSQPYTRTMDDLTRMWEQFETQSTCACSTTRFC